MQAGVGAVIASVVWDMGGSVVKQKDAASIVIMLAGVCRRVRVPRERGVYHPRLHRPWRFADAACKEEERMIYWQLF